MKLNKIKYLLIYITLLGCSNDDDPISLSANAGLNQEVMINELVTLDGSASAGPAGFTYLWTYSGDVPESGINFTGTNTATPKFTPPKGAVYSFTLTISSNGQSSSDQVTVIASGGVELSGELTEDLQLEDIEPNADLPDYVVTSDLIVPDGITLSVKDENVVVFFESSAGLHIRDGGILKNTSPQAEEGFNVVLTGNETTGWKGILIENGEIELNHSTIKYAGNASFSEVDEAGALVLTGAQTNLVSIDGNDFDGSLSYDVYAPDRIGGEGRFRNNFLSYTNPFKAHISFTEYFISNDPNRYPNEYEYNIVVPSGTMIKDIASSSSSTFQMTDGKFLIDGSLWAGARLSFNRARIYMKEGAAILAEDDFNSGTAGTGSNDSGVIFTGHNGAEWKGIAVINRGQFSIAYTTIENAGNGLISFAEFTAEANASIYVNRDVGTIRTSVIRDGGGFGYYNEDTVSLDVATRVYDNTFSNLSNAAIRTNVASIARLFFNTNERNIYELGEGIPAILVQGNGRPISTWPALGDDNFYLIDALIDHETYSDPWSLEPGVHLKFKQGRYYKYNAPNVGAAQPILFEGTAENPIIIEGEVDREGSWGGMFLGGLDGYYKIDHCIIRNGGEFIIPGATEKANVVSAYGGSLSSLVRFQNTSITGSEGYGIVVENGSIDFDFENPAKNNTFSDNATGNVIVK